MISEKRAKRLKRKKKRIVSLIIIAVIVVLGYFLVNNQFVKGLYYKVSSPISDKNPVISINENNSSKFLSFKNILISTLGNNITAYNVNGEQVEKNNFSNISASTAHYNNLHLKACDNYVIAFDKGGLNAVVFNNKKITAAVTVNSKILLAKPFNNGEFLIISEDSNAKNKIALYSDEGKEKFIWHSGVNNIIDGTYSYKANKLVIITTELSTGHFNSKVVFFDILNPNPYSETTFENAFFTNINFYSKNSLIALSDVGTYYFNVNGDLVNSYSFNNKMLSCYKQMPKGAMALSFGSKSGNDTIVEIINNKGKLVGTYTSTDDIYSIDENNGVIVICGLRNASIITKSGMLVRTLEYNKDLKKAFFLKNKFILVANSEVRIVK